MTKTKYLLAFHHTRVGFENIVQAYLDAGWKLRGGVSVTINQANSKEFYQTLVKKVKT